MAGSCKCIKLMKSLTLDAASSDSSVSVSEEEEEESMFHNLISLCPSGHFNCSGSTSIVMVKEP